MPDRTWKKVERESCRELGGERRGPTGRDLPDCDDAVKVGLEIKSYKSLVFLTKDWEQAVRNAEKLGLMPVLYVREGGRNGRRMVQLRATDFTLLAASAGGTAAFIGGGLCRLPWPEFVRHYNATFNHDKETLG